jgi:hypothetical protein
MHSGNAYLHGMKSVMKGSLAYIATQVHWKFYNDPPLTATLGSVFIKLLLSIFHAQTQSQTQKPSITVFLTFWMILMNVKK